jgi:hypothetical protein
MVAISNLSTMDRPMSPDAELSVSPEAQLSYESRTRTRQMVVAIAAGVLLMVAAILDRTGAHAAVSELTISLLVDHKRKSINLRERPQRAPQHLHPDPHRRWWAADDRRHHRLPVRSRSRLRRVRLDRPADL